MVLLISDYCLLLTILDMVLAPVTPDPQTKKFRDFRSGF